MSERLVGFSTGCLCRVNQYLIEKIEMFKQAGARALELNLASVLELFSFPLENNELLELIKSFKFVTIHAPWNNIIYYPIDGENNKTLSALKRVCNIAKQIFTQGVIMHPDIVGSFAALNTHGFSIFLENMDERKRVDKTPEDFKLVKDNYNFSYVLDLQHIFTVDPSMDMVKIFVELWGEKLRCVHVSGQTESSNHCPLHIADNRTQILKGLKMIPADIPIILEGMIAENNHKKIKETLKKELDLIRFDIQFY